MKKIKDFWESHKLYCLAVFYIALIPIFALIYYSIPNALNFGDSFVDYIYFSAITLTTLGYGDILPITACSKLVASSQAVLGVVMIGLFLNTVSHRISEEARQREIEKEKQIYREKEIAKLYGIHKLAAPLISEYKSIVTIITSPLPARKTEYNPDFKLNDIKDLFKSTYLIKNGFYEPAIEIYYRILPRLTSELSDVIKNIDTRLFPDIEKSCLEFIEAYYNYNVSGNILNAKHMKAGNESFEDIAEKALADYKGEQITASEVLTPYYILAVQIKLQMAAIINIEIAFDSLLEL